MSKGKVLIVDLDGETLDQTTRALRESGFETLPTRGCVADVTRVIHGRPDVIVMDACGNCRRRGGHRSDLRDHCAIGEIPVVLLTERCDVLDHDCAFKAGVQKYLLKPFDPLELEMAIEELLERTAVGV